MRAGFFRQGLGFNAENLESFNDRWRRLHRIMGVGWILQLSELKGLSPKVVNFE